MNRIEQPQGLSEWIQYLFQRHPLLSWAVVGVSLVLFLLWLLAPDVPEVDPLQQQSQKEIEQREQKLLAYVVNMLERCDEYELEHVTTRVVERLNQWLEFRRSARSWKLPQVVVRYVPSDIQRQLGFSRLGRLQFEHHEGVALLESVWLRWISEQAVRQQSPGETQDSLQVAQRLFDWTVRNIQMEDVGEREVYELPWQTLLFGRGHPLNRAWVFMLLVRQQGMEAVLLAFPGKKKDEPPRPWIPAVYVDGELYLFDHMLGLPIPGPGGRGVASLRQAAEDPRILRQLDVPGRFTYPVRAEQLEQVIALFEASPHFLSRRMRMLEDQLAGSHRLVLSIHADYLAEELGRCAHIKQVRPWLWPYQCRLRQSKLQSQERQAALRKLVPFLQLSGQRIKGKRSFNLEKALAKAGWKFLEQREEGQIPDADSPEQEKEKDRRTEVEVVERPLWRARILHFRGELEGEQGAVHHYQLVRVPDRELQRLRQQMRQRLDRQLEQMQRNPALSAQQRKEIQQQLQQQAETLWQAMTQAKEDATYWLGLASYDRGDYPLAVEYFKQRILQHSEYRRWIDGARYNLGRSYEALGKYAEAVAAYESDTSLQRHGNVLRALRLQRKLTTTQPADAQ